MSEYRFIPLSGKKGHGLFAKVSPEDYPKVSQHSWCLSHEYPVSRMGGGPVIYLHRLLADAKKGDVVDHKDGDTLNAVRGNLRICSTPDNLYNQAKRRSAKNSSSFKGVSWDGKRKRWIAAVAKDGVIYRLGGFESEIKAAEAYDSVAAYLFGAFARLNFDAAEPVSPLSFRRENDVAQFSSSFLGVHWHKAAGKWAACLYVEGKRHHLGLFLSELDAARAYKDAATRLKGRQS